VKEKGGGQTIRENLKVRGMPRTEKTFRIIQRITEKPVEDGTESPERRKK